MPFTLSMEDDLFVVELTGTITTQDFIDLATGVLGFERTRTQTPNRFTDMSGASALAIDYADIERVAHMRRTSPPANPIRSAIYAPSDVQFGMARMFQTLNDHPDVTVEVFRERSAALAWLRAGGPGPA